MKLAITQDSGETTGTNAFTIDSAPNTAGGFDASFGSYHTVPDDYTKVAHKEAGTDMTANTGGVKLTSTYAAYISKNQPAGTYAGQVKYTLVHPHDGTAPTIPSLGPNPPASCNTPFPATGITYMQDINSSNKSAILTSLTTEQPYYLRDSRDGEPYCVSKLKDGNLWMLDNLRLDLTNSVTLANTTELTTNASATSLDYLKNGGGTSSDRYATSAVSEWATNPTYSEGNSYSDPLIATSGDCYDADYCSNDPQSGKWTKDSLPPDYDNEHTYYGNGSGKIGVYYNYCAVSAGSYCYGDGSEDYGNPSDDATEDICPKNWRMPTGGSDDGEYYTLYSYYDSTYDPTDSNSLQYNLSLLLSGDFSYGMSNRDPGAGFFWTSSVGESGMYIFVANFGGVQPDSAERQNGVSLRCLVGS